MDEVQRNHIGNSPRYALDSSDNESELHILRVITVMVMALFYLRTFIEAKAIWECRGTRKS